MAGKSHRRWFAALVVVALVATAAIAANKVWPRIHAALAGPGCAAGDAKAAVPLDPQQAAIAATIAGVAHHKAMPAHAVTVAYAAAMQETHLHNLPSGDRDSVGVFQQRPSQGWGPASKLMNPVYATTAFLRVLAKVPRYRRLPVYQAAQDVQHSADGFAYAQYQRMAATLAAAFTGHLPHAVWCWSAGAVTGRPTLRAARSELTRTFGALLTHVAATSGDAPSLTVTAGHTGLGWSVAAWLVTHAPQYHLTAVRFEGYQWRATASHPGWARASGRGAPATVVAS